MCSPSSCLTAASTSASAGRLWQNDGLSFPAVLVGEAHNVVLTAIVADLNFDQMEQYQAGLTRRWMLPIGI
jgi:hypothetical protein